jgi:hypothetical protein
MTLFVPEREDAAGMKKTFCGCVLVIHFFSTYLYTVTVIIGIEIRKLKSNTYGMKESSWN